MYTLIMINTTYTNQTMCKITTTLKFNIENTQNNIKDV